MPHGAGREGKRRQGHIGCRQSLIHEKKPFDAELGTGKAMRLADVLIMLLQIAKGIGKIL